MAGRQRPVTLTVRLTDDERQLVHAAAAAARCCSLADWLVPMAQWTIANPKAAAAITERSGPDEN